MAALRPVSDRSLRTTIVLLVGGTIFGLTLLILLSVLYVTRRESQRAVQRDFATTSIVLRQTLEMQTDVMGRISASLTNRPDTFIAQLMAGPQKKGDEDPRRDWGTVSDIAADLSSQLDASDVVITDRLGTAIGDSSATTKDRGASLSGQPGTASALAGKSWHGVVLRDRRLAIEVALPVNSPGQPYVIGTIAAFRPMGTPLAQAVAKALGCEVAFASDGAITGSSIPLANLPALPAIARGDAISPPFDVTADGQRYVGSYQSVRLNPQDAAFGVVLLRPYAEATALPRALEEGLVLPVFVALLLALFVATVVARGVTTPLDGVVAAAHELREGRWPRRFEVVRRDEIGLLQTVFNEMSESLRAAQGRLLAMIDSDVLTELDNHRRFQERLAQEMQRAADSNEPLSLLLVDLDHFQAFNQTYGHQAGDTALKAAAATIRAVMPRLGTAARYGGEEFALLVPRLRSTEIFPFAEQLRTEIASVAEHGLTVSVGYAERGAGLEEPDSLTLAAELALTQAKQLGRDRVCGFDTVAVTSPGGAADMASVPLHRFLRDGSLATMQALAAAVDAKDPYTQGHSRRVADLASQMAKRLGLSPEESYLVFTTGTLHDVGKIGVPDRVLQKPGRLDAEERQLMETHPVLGEVIVGKAPQLAQALPGVRSHHERWDGKGYPDGLAGTDIPLIARVLALADTYDAMTSDRPYRQGMAVSIAIDEIARNAGTQFDPDLTPLFVQMMREITER